MASDQAEAQSFIAQGRGYVTGAVDELKKVTTPTRQETIQATMVAIVIMLFVAVCLLVLDLIFSTLMKAVLS